MREAERTAFHAALERYRLEAASKKRRPLQERQRIEQWRRYPPRSNAVAVCTPGRNGTPPANAMRLTVEGAGNKCVPAAVPLSGKTTAVPTSLPRNIDGLVFPHGC